MGRRAVQGTLCLPVGIPPPPPLPRSAEGNAERLGLGGTRGGQEKTGAGMRLPPPAPAGERSGTALTPGTRSAGGGSSPKVPCGTRAWGFWVSPRFPVLG